MCQLFSPAGLLCVAGTLSLLAPSSGRAQTPAQTPAPPVAKNSESPSVVLHFRWIKPSEFVASLTQPRKEEDDAENSWTPYSGLQRVSPDDATNRVFVQGSGAAVKQIQELAQLVDVEPRRVYLTVRILRAPANQFAPFAEPDQKLRKGTVISGAAAVFKNNEAITLHAVADGQPFHIPLTPHINGDDSVSLTVDVSDAPVPLSEPFAPLGGKEAKAKPGGEKRFGTQRLAPEAKLLVASKPYWKDSNLAYYLEITPVVQQRLGKP